MPADEMGRRKVRYTSQAGEPVIIVDVEMVTRQGPRLRGGVPSAPPTLEYPTGELPEGGWYWTTLRLDTQWTEGDD